MIALPSFPSLAEIAQTATESELEVFAQGAIDAAIYIGRNLPADIVDDLSFIAEHPTIRSDLRARAGILLVGRITN